MQNQESVSESKEMNGAKKLTENKESTTLPTAQPTPPRLTRAEYMRTPIVVSQKQYEAVETNHTNSISLLDSCANVLLDAMASAVPPRDSGRMIGEYTGQNLRQIAKSVCDLVQTKTAVVRSMYQISRDEF